MEKIVLGMSGGVDSSAAVALLRERGYEVHGLFLSHSGLDCGAALRAAAETGVPLEIADIGEALEREVCRRFEREYLAGRTPSPCIYCNPLVKFPALIAEAERIGAELVATGHYARTERRDGYTALLRAHSPNDQSYMLCRLPQHILSRCVFPLGELDKQQVRDIAARGGLSSASARDSMEICFVPSGDYGAWLEGRGADPRKGDFLSEHGETLGTHDGLYRYTVGKRRGLRIATGKRMYVKRIDPNTNSITLAEESNMYITKVEISGFMRLRPELGDSFHASAKLRHSRSEHACAVEVSGGRAVLTLEAPARIPAPGQYAALYIADELVASGIIERSE